MNWHTITILGLGFPTLLLVLVATSIIFERLVRVLGYKQELNALGHDTWLLLFGLLFARIGYVLQNWPYYANTPIDILNIRDQGFSIIAALVPIFIWITFKKRGNVRRIGMLLMLVLLSVIGIVKWGQSTTQFEKLFEQVSLKTFSMMHTESSLPTSHAKTVLLTELLAEAKANNKAVIINLWASWCPPCRREMPALQMVQSKRDDVVIILINQQESEETIIQFFSENNLSFNHVYLDAYGSMMNNNLLHALPSTLYIDNQGNWRGIHTGELTQSALHAKIDSLIVQ